MAAATPRRALLPIAELRFPQGLVHLPQRRGFCLSGALGRFDRAAGEFPRLAKTSVECFGVSLLGKKDVFDSGFAVSPVHLPAHLRPHPPDRRNPIQIDMHVRVIPLALQHFLICGPRVIETIQVCVNGIQDSCKRRNCPGLDGGPRGLRRRPSHIVPWSRD